MREIGMLAIAGAAGTLCRYGMSLMIQRWAGPGFPWGTLAVNVLGCFLFGLIFTITQNRAALSETARLVLLTGFMGAFTTFSTFAFDTGIFLRDAKWLGAAGNFVAQNLLGVTCLFLGFLVGRQL
jgi:CrcB protein